jgi:DNA-binding XRE family transcriptional regulator
VARGSSQGSGSSRAGRGRSNSADSESGNVQPQVDHRAYRPMWAAAGSEHSTSADWFCGLVWRRRPTGSTRSLTSLPMTTGAGSRRVMLQQKLGQRIADLRREKSLTQGQLARMTGYSVEFVSLVERGVNGPSIAGLEKLAMALKVDVRDLFNFNTRWGKHFWSNDS